MIRVTIWGENVHEQTNKAVRQLYPEGMHHCIAEGLSEDPDLQTQTAVLQMPEHGLNEEILDQTDVLTWWGHAAHDKVSDEIVERVHQRVLQGMGLIVLHSGHLSKIFKRLLGTPCSLSWREAGEKERVWVIQPSHPIAEGLGRYFEVENAEMYGEPFAIPNPEDVVFISWFEGGEVFRSGVTFQRGAGKIFYFRPGHETYPVYYNDSVKLVLKNAVKWAAPKRRWEEVADCPNVPASQAPEKIVVRGPSVHQADGTLQS